MIWHNKNFDRLLSGKIKFLCASLEEKIWTQNHVLSKLTHVAYCITPKRDPLNKNNPHAFPPFTNNSATFGEIDFETFNNFFI